MKRKLLFISAIALASCNAPANKQAHLDSLKADSTKAVAEIASRKVDTGKMLLDSSDNLVKKSMAGELLRTEVNKHIKPIMTHYFAIVKTLSPADTTTLFNYRMKKINELVDIKVQQNKH